MRLLRRIVELNYLEKLLKEVLVEIEKKATEELRAAETGLDICVVTIIDLSNNNTLCSRIYAHRSWSFFN